MSDPKPSVQFSVVVPFHNEGAVAFAVVDELCRSLEALNLRWEAILVDDGSSDQTGSELHRAAARWPACRIVTLARNQGQGRALYEGFAACRGELIGMMDGDGQNVPGDFGKLLALLGRADLVVGIRGERNDSWARRIASRIANTIRGRVLGDRVRDAGCALKVFRWEVSRAFVPIAMLNPFMPALAVAHGFRLAQVAVGHRPRRAGASHYGLSRILVKPALEMLTVWWLMRRTRPTRSQVRVSAT